jgi:hypothetical protein
MEATMTVATTALATTSAAHTTASLGAALFFIALYFVPTMIAWGRKANKKGGITALNVFLGWTGIGWIAAFIWAVSADNKND